MKNIIAEVDHNSGFCFGVVYAIELAEEFLEEHGKLYCLGDIVHNDLEVKRLEAKGLRIIDHEQLKSLEGERVLIRAHGEAPETYKIALENNLELVDASCPVVLKLQNRVKTSFDQKNRPIFIYGKHGHAEVKGLLGQTGQEAFVFQDIKELADKELPDEIELFSQTTKDTANLYKIKEYLESRGVEVYLHDTICRQVSNRDVQLRDFVNKYDKIVFVAGTKSSNGKVLYNVCKGHNEYSYFVSTPEEVKEEWFGEKDRVGICGATSTPAWLMEEVKERILAF